MKLRAITALLMAGALVSTTAFAAEYIWQKPQAKVLPTGSLEWAPEPFEFHAGATIRYIDYESGDDSNAGTKDAPWKHHPWDVSATDRAKAGVDGPATYVFKGGVIYRGRLEGGGGGGGTAEEPIRLTRDPDWGEGPAIFAGSHRIEGGWQQGGEGLSDKVQVKEQIWYIDLPKGVEPRTLWMTGAAGEDPQRLLLARHPNWHIAGDDEDNIPHDWFESGDPLEPKIINDKEYNHIKLDESLPRDPDFYDENTIIRAEWGPVMGSPTPVPVEEYNPQDHTIVFHRFMPGGGRRGIFWGSRYSFENNPLYIDEPGEWWFDDKGENSGRLYLYAPEGVDPNSVVFEAGKEQNLLSISGTDYLEITGLTFRFTNMPARPNWFWENTPMVIVYKGGGKSVTVAHNRFEHINQAIDVNANARGEELEVITFSDNVIHYSDEGVAQIRENDGGRIGDLYFLRNDMYHVGMWPQRMSHGHAVDIRFPETAVVAGNILHRAGGWGLCIFGGKGNRHGGSVPFARYLVFHNLVKDALLMSNDWGSIETWQGGPFYVFSNHVHNPVGIMGFGKRRFGHAYYMDGGFKNYHFNNIASGESSAPGDIEASTAAFQEIHSYQNTFFHNTVFRFLNGSRRQAPQAGRDKFLGNIFQDIGERVFRHSDSKNTDPNAMDAGEQVAEFAYNTNAYGGNVLYKVNQVGNFHAAGGDYEEVDPFAKALAEENTMIADVGVMAAASVLQAPEEMDFRPVADSAVIGTGIKAFVPWSLHGVVGEWNFFENQADPTIVIDEHWYMTYAHVNRHHYYDVPTYPLKAVNVAAEDYAQGELEDWVDGALTLDGENQYLVLSHKDIAAPVKYRAGKEEKVMEGKDKPTVDVYDQNFLIEAYLKLDDADGVIARKMSDQAGYELRLEEGKPALQLRSGGEDLLSLTADDALPQGQWVHLLVEIDRENGAKFYVDGQETGAQAEGQIATESLQNEADFTAGGGPDLDHLKCTLDFLRVAHGSLQDAKTSIGELYAWQFDGPFLKDFTGAAPSSPEARDAGALQSR